MRQPSKEQDRCHNLESESLRFFAGILPTTGKIRTVSEAIAPYGAMGIGQIAS